MHAFGTLSQILGVRLRSWRGIFSYSNNYKLDIVGRHGQVLERLHLSSTSHCAMAQVLPCPHNHEPYDYRMQHDFSYEYIWGN